MDFKNVCDIVGPHIESYNYLIGEGLRKAVEDISPEEFQFNFSESKVKPIVCIRLSNVHISPPSADIDSSSIGNIRTYPSECRQRGINYGGKMRVTINMSINNQELDPIEKIIGEFPVMVKSKLCNLYGLSAQDLIKRGEEEKEMGGYFIVNGTEKIIRLLIMNRRNYPMVFSRNGWKGRGETYTEHGIYIRCVRDNHTSTNNTLHYLMTRRMMFCLIYRKEMFFVPFQEILRALVDESEAYIFDALMCGRETDDIWAKSVKNMLKDLQMNEISSRNSALKRLGELFRVSMQVPEWYTDIEVGRLLLKRCVLIHLNSDKEKFDLLCYMAQKLRTYVAGECRADDPDNIMFHEAAMPGHILLMLLKEKLEIWLERFRKQLQDDIKKKGTDILLGSKGLSDAIKSAMGFNVSRQIEYFLATGTLISSSGLGMQQTTGFCIIAERLNYLRFVSHFRGIHRGSFFTTMRATSVRKLKPEAWGFLCPVHTPDGTPCGLLNHLTANCRVVSLDGGQQEFENLCNLLFSLGVLTLDEFRALHCDSKNFMRVFVDSRWIGWVEDIRAQKIVNFLRSKKISGFTDATNFYNPFTEIALVPKPRKTGVKGIYPGLFILTTPGRLIRPVTTHQELSPHSFLSYVANLIPFSDHNQSPRNVYQCQMGKQTMGVPVHRLEKRIDNKLYRLQTPQSPLVRPQAYDDYGVDEYGLGTNAIVAVISYTGYDMEDSMVINKTSYERGFAQASVLKCERIKLIQSGKRSKGAERCRFSRNPAKLAELESFIDEDGLPYVGQLYHEHDPYYCYKSEETGQYTVKNYHHSTPARVHHIKVCNDSSKISSNSDLNHVCITMREERNPSMGDKFASRHGQKGMMSFLWPSENMPFSETGMVPDIIFNPHGFPSRMTVGMMIEFMAGKSAALHGLRHDATPFVFSEDKPAVKYFGDLLTKAGYNYLGNEPIYSGIDGREMKADIFFGVVYYQKLRHMVEDKYQVRATGPIDELTGQPVHGRKRGGGVRFGEMERDGLISHGCAFLLQDRLFNCSDKDYAEVCQKCGSSVGVYKQAIPPTDDHYRQSSIVNYCRICKSADNVKIVPIPTVFKLLNAELAAMNIKMQFNVSS
uniref:DNA-directed RNA polymerase n=1 Tax=Romanomermis culicivorax TaxID=13658 RepID=A0A915KBH9_ROMCU